MLPKAPHIKLRAAEASFLTPRCTRSSRTVARCFSNSAQGACNATLHTQFIRSKPSFRLQDHHRRQKLSSSFIVHADRDFYNLLGVPRSADKKAIKAAYRQKARQYHPDVNKDPGAEDMFKDISAAYEVLSDDEQRRVYDQFGEAGLKGMGGMGGGPGMGDVNPFDIFEQFFGGGMGGMGGMGGGGFGGAGGRVRNRPTQGEVLRYDLKIDFLEAVFGCQKEIDISRLEKCGTCSGSGTKPGTQPTSCSTCGGSGQVIQAVRTPLGMFQQMSTCPACGGQGQISTPCGTCGGDGRVRGSKRISLRVPPGVDEGSRLRVRGEGDAGQRGGPPGDLYVFITVKAHPDGLKRDDTTIHSDIEIPYYDAILGTAVQITTVDGKVDLKIPAGTQPGTTLVMAKRGVPKLGASSTRGDHLVHVKVRIPKKVGEKDRQLIEELKSGDKSGESAGRKWF